MIRTLCFTAIAALIPQWVYADDFGQWSPFVPATGKAKAEVMVMDAPADINEISKRVEQAARLNPQWFSNYAIESEPGKPLPYHENMGITETEYQRLLDGANELVLTNAGSVEISFSVLADGHVALRGLPMTPPNDQLIYDPDTERVLTANGALTDMKTIDQDDAKTPTGRWAGLEWKRNVVNSAKDFSQIRLSIGQMKDKELNIIYYDVNVADDGGHDQYEYILLYDKH